MKIQKIKKAEYDGNGKQKTNAVYGVFESDKQVAQILKTLNGWRTCKPTNQSKLGLAISPIEINSFRAVKKWAINHFKQVK